MSKIHLIERITNVKLLSKEKNEWASYSWVLTEETAQKLVGGEIYLHKGQDKPSHFGGKILSYELLPESAGKEAGRIVFNFCAGLEFKNIKAGKEGWGMEKKIVW
jgi:hypothetical protein